MQPGHLLVGSRAFARPLHSGNPEYDNNNLSDGALLESNGRPAETDKGNTIMLQNDNATSVPEQGILMNTTQNVITDDLLTNLDASNDAIQLVATDRKSVV